jgi:hypothetical protein
MKPEFPARRCGREPMAGVPGVPPDRATVRGVSGRYGVVREDAKASNSAEEYRGCPARENSCPIPVRNHAASCLPVPLAANMDLGLPRKSGH